MGHRLDGAREKLERANQHFRELDAALEEFRQSDPYEIVFDDEPDTGDQVYWGRIKKEIPLRVSAILGDVIYDLRSSLDHVAWQLVDAGAGIPSDDLAQRAIGFPISDSREEFEAKGLAKVDGACNKAKRIIETIEPYKGGNDLLWQLHRLNLVDKHRLLITIVTQVQGIVARSDMGFPPGELAEFFGVSEKDIPVMSITINSATPEPLIHDAEMYRIPKALRESYYYGKHQDFTLAVAFDEPGIAEREPVLTTVSQIGSSVQQTIELFERLLA